MSTDRTSGSVPTLQPAGGQGRTGGNWGDVFDLLCCPDGPRFQDLSLVPLHRGRALVVSNRLAPAARSTILHYRYRAGQAERWTSWGLAGLASLPGGLARGRSLSRLGFTGGSPDGDRLWAEFVHTLGADLVTFGAVLRPPGPEWTPIVHLFDRTGERRAVAKIGFSDPARRCIRREAAALRAAARQPIDAIVPRALGLVEHERATVLLQSPLPRAARPLDDAVVGADIVAAVSSITATDELDESHQGYLLERVEHLDLDPEGAWRDVLSRPYPRARCHGDLVHWNVARAGRRPLIWDWEYSFPDAPRGFDLLQSRYRMAREAGRSVSTAIHHANRTAQPLLSDLGLGPRDRGLVTAVHTLDAAVRLASRIDVAGAPSHLAAEALATCRLGELA